MVVDVVVLLVVVRVLVVVEVVEVPGWVKVLWLALQ